MPVRFGYDVVEVVWIEETSFGVTPTTGTWKHAGLPTGFEPRPQLQWKEKVGLGNQIITDNVKIKEFAELTFAYELLKEQATPAYQWTNLIAYILGETGEATTINLEKRIKSLSIGAKLELATDEFWLFKGCKLNTLELSGNVETNEPIVATLGIISQKASYGTTDYVSGTATRQAAPTTDYILPSDCDLLYGGSSIYARLSEWRLRINRNLIKRGRDDTDKTLFRSFEEGKVEVELSIVLDFDSRIELEDFLNATKKDVAIQVPSGTGGRSINLTGGKWREATIPKRELELIALTLTAPYTDINISTIT